jgi:hypothetical protein
VLQYEIALFAGSLTIFLNYIIGKPGSEFSPYEIFSSYTVWLSRWRLKRIGLYDQYYKEFEKEYPAFPKWKKIEVDSDFKKIIYNAADPFFTWERAVGMCSICTGFWISLAIGLIFTHNFLALIEIVVFSHIAIRIFNKLL